jgi:hypothetical protein
MSAFINDDGKLRVPPTKLILELPPTQIDELDEAITTAIVDTRQQIAWLQSEGKDTAAAGQALSHFERGRQAIAAARGNTEVFFNSRHPLDQLSAMRQTLNRLLDVYNAAQRWHHAWTCSDTELVAEYGSESAWDVAIDKIQDELVGAVEDARRFFSEQTS